MICVANECNSGGFDNTIVSANNDEIADTIEYIHNISTKKYYIGASLTGGQIPSEKLINVSDIILLHGNSQTAQDIKDMIDKVKQTSSYKSKAKPILFTEDPATNFNSSSSNMMTAINNGASWGYMADCDSHDGNNYIDAYQCPPTAWNLNTDTKQEYFEAIHVVTS